jgi:hypothetical protein
VPALDPIRGLRVVALPGALDAARWTAGDTGQVTILRLAPDDVLAIGAVEVQVEDPDAIVEPEAGFVGGWCSLEDLRPQTEWAVPTERPALAQGAVAGVPAKVWLPDDGDVLLVVSAAHAAVLTERLGWHR